MKKIKRIYLSGMFWICLLMTLICAAGLVSSISNHYGTGIGFSSALICFLVFCMFFPGLGWSNDAPPTPDEDREWNFKWRKIQMYRTLLARQDEGLLSNDDKALLGVLTKDATIKTYIEIHNKEKK